jgi:hypothetical protein
MSTGRPPLLSVTSHTASGRRGRSSVAVVAAAIVFAWLCAASPAWGDRVDDLTKSLEKDKDEKTRISAAVALGSMKDARVVPALIKALRDDSAVVRGLAANALKNQGDASAIDALEAALADESSAVRTRARDALKALREKKGNTGTTGTGTTGTVASNGSSGTTTTTTAIKPTNKSTADAGGSKPKVYVVVKNMGNKTTAGGKELAKNMRDTVVHELERAPEITLDSNVGGKLTQLVVDGSIHTLNRANNGPWIEVTCEVKLTVSTAEGRMMSIVSGSATVQMPRGTFKTSMEKSMQVEAVENAVRGAHQNLYTFLTKQASVK